MNKAELVEKVARKTGLTLKDAKIVVDAIFTTVPKEGIIASELNKGKKVQITGFGTFTTKKRRKRKSRNPQTGEPIEIPPSRFPSFAAGQPLKTQIMTGTKSPTIGSVGKEKDDAEKRFICEQAIERKADHFPSKTKDLIGQDAIPAKSKLTSGDITDNSIEKDLRIASDHADFSETIWTIWESISQIDNKCVKKIAKDLEDDSDEKLQ